MFVERIGVLTRGERGPKAQTEKVGGRLWKGMCLVLVKRT
jgi:hypothetical protein